MRVTEDTFYNTSKFYSNALCYCYLGVNLYKTNHPESDFCYLEWVPRSMIIFRYFEFFYECIISLELCGKLFLFIKKELKV